MNIKLVALHGKRKVLTPHQGPENTTYQRLRGPPQNERVSAKVRALKPPGLAADPQGQGQRLAPVPIPPSPRSLSEPSRPPRWNRDFLVQLAWILVTVFAVVGVLFGTGITGLCHVAENRSVRFYHRCDSALQYLPLTGLLVLIGGYVIAHLAHMPWVRAMAILGAFVPLLVTWHLLAV